MEEVRAKWADIAPQIEESALRPKKTDIRLELFGLAWVPHWLFTYQDERGTIQHERVPAYPLT